MNDVRGAGAELADEREVEHVTLDEAEVRVLGKVGAGERVAVQIVEDHDLVLLDEAPRERRADEACPARHEDLFPAQRHDGGVYRRVIPAN